MNKGSRTAGTLAAWLCIFSLGIFLFNLTNTTLSELQREDVQLVPVLLNLGHNVPAILAFIIKICGFFKKKAHVVSLGFAIDIFAKATSFIPRLKAEGITFPALVYVALCTVPAVMIIVMAEGYKKPRFVYLPAIIYFILTIVHSAFFPLQIEIVSSISVAITTAIFLLSGLFVRTYHRMKKERY